MRHVLAFRNLNSFVTMRKTFVHILIICACAFSAVGCNGYNKLLKSKDHELQYREALNLYDAKKYTKAITLLEIAAPYAYGSMYEDSLAYYKAASHYKNGDFETSSQLLDQFRLNYGTSPFLEDAEYMYAKGFYFRSPEPNRDQDFTNRALIAMNEYLSRYPESPKKEAITANMSELMEKLQTKSYINAKSYYDTGEYKAAIVSLRNAINAFPDSKYREEMMYLLTKSSFLLASNSISSLQRSRYLDMIDTYYNFISEYPQSKYVKELDKMQNQAKAFIAKAGEEPKNNNTQQ